MQDKYCKLWAPPVCDDCLICCSRKIDGKNCSFHMANMIARCWSNSESIEGAQASQKGGQFGINERGSCFVTRWALKVRRLTLSRAVDIMTRDSAVKPCTVVIAPIPRRSKRRRVAALDAAMPVTQAPQTMLLIELPAPLNPLLAQWSILTKCCKHDVRLPCLVLLMTQDHPRDL